MVRISFNGDLKDLLKNDGKDQWIYVKFHGKRSVKDLIQSLGIPHTEVGDIQVNRQCAKLTYILRDGDTVVVFPLSPGRMLVDKDPPGFICDVHLWKLARRLRLLGFDTRFNPEWDDPDLADISQKECLVLLSRDRGLLKRNKVEQGLLIRNTDPEKQVIEVLHRLDISDKAAPLTRCLICNNTLVRMATTFSNYTDSRNTQQFENRDLNKKKTLQFSKTEALEELFEKRIKPQLPPKILEWCSEFHFCANCEKTFWKGSHYDKLIRMIEKYIGKSRRINKTR
jgi:uncharacterized protein with PIN domain